MEKIDFIITWVDSSDQKWIEEKNKYEITNDLKKVDARNNRYRDMNCLKYWFRGVEKYAPWVNKIFFVTYGHYPEWLNIDNKKIKIIKHSEFIPEKFLPTFNSNAIEAAFHKIQGISERFVYFNDDMFLINKTKEKDFFRNGIPYDSMSFNPLVAEYGDKHFYKKICNDMEIINKYFSFKEFVKNNRKKVFALNQYKHIPINYIFSGFKSFVGFFPFHLPVPYLKETFEEVWKKEPNILDKTMSFKFRNNDDSVNHWLFEYWQFASGKFIQRPSNFGIYTRVNEKNIEKILLSTKYKVICINDTAEFSDFESDKEKIITCFEKKFPQKSSFEK